MFQFANVALGGHQVHKIQPLCPVFVACTTFAFPHHHQPSWTCVHLSDTPTTATSSVMYRYLDDAYGAGFTHRRCVFCCCLFSLEKIEKIYG